MSYKSSFPSFEFTNFRFESSKDVKRKRLSTDVRRFVSSSMNICGRQTRRRISIIVVDAKTELQRIDHNIFLLLVIVDHSSSLLH